MVLPLFVKRLINPALPIHGFSHHYNVVMIGYKIHILEDKQERKQFEYARIYGILWPTIVF